MCMDLPARARVCVCVVNHQFRSWCDVSSDPSLMVDPLSYFSFQPVHYDWCNKGRDMCYAVCGVMDIKEPYVSGHLSMSDAI